MPLRNHRDQLVREIELLLPNDAPDVGRELALQAVADTWRDLPLGVLVRLRDLASARELADQSAVGDKLDSLFGSWCSHCERHVWVDYTGAASRCGSCGLVL